MMKYHILNKTFTAGGVLKPANGCNAIAFVNSGDEIAYINGTALAVGASMANNGQAGEIDQTTYQIAFAGGGSAPRLDVRYKEYV